VQEDEIRLGGPGARRIRDEHRERVHRLAVLIAVEDTVAGVPDTTRHALPLIGDLVILGEESNLAILAEVGDENRRPRLRVAAGARLVVEEPL